MKAAANPKGQVFYLQVKAPGPHTEGPGSSSWPQLATDADGFQEAAVTVQLSRFLPPLMTEVPAPLYTQPPLGATEGICENKPALWDSLLILFPPNLYRSSQEFLSLFVCVCVCWNTKASPGFKKKKRPFMNKDSVYKRCVDCNQHCAFPTPPLNLQILHATQGRDNHSEPTHQSCSQQRHQWALR